MNKRNTYIPELKTRIDFKILQEEMAHKFFEKCFVNVIITAKRVGR